MLNTLSLMKIISEPVVESFLAKSLLKYAMCKLDSQTVSSLLTVNSNPKSLGMAIFRKKKLSTI